MVHNFQNITELEDMMAVNETIVPFWGLLKFKQYISGKARFLVGHKYGVKIFKICGVNGYTYNIEVQGKAKLMEEVAELLYI